MKIPYRKARLRDPEMVIFQYSDLSRYQRNLFFSGTLKKVNILDHRKPK